LRASTEIWCRALWASIAGCALSHAYLGHGAWAWLGVLALGVALVADEPQTPRRLVLIGAIVQAWVGLNCWGFLHYGAPLFLATLLYSIAAGALFGFLLTDWGRSTVRVTPLRAGVAWLAVEWLRQLGPVGFPLFVGGTQAGLPVRSALAVVGSVGLSGLMVAFGVSVVIGLHARRSRKVIGWLALLLATVLVGRWQPLLEEEPQPLDLAVVQAGMPNWVYVVAHSSAAAKSIVQSAFFEPAEAALTAGADVVFLPESALHRPIPWHDGELGEALFRPPPGEVSGYVVTGAYRELLHEADWGSRIELYNSAVLLAGTRADVALDHVDKRLLAPIVEIEYRRGTRDPVLSAGDVGVGVLICYESMYQRLARSAVREANLLAILTNDAGFAWAPVTETHSRQGLARTIETGRPGIRAAQAGISWIVDGTGVVTTRAGLFERDLLEASVTPIRGLTWFTAGGWLLGPLSLLGLAGWIGLARRRAAGTATAS